MDEAQQTSQPVDATLESVRSSLPHLPGLSDDFEREIDEAFEEEAERILRRREPQ